MTLRANLREAISWFSRKKNSLESETLYFLLKHNRKETMTSLATMEEILHPQRIEVCLVLILGNQITDKTTYKQFLSDPTY